MAISCNFIDTIKVGELREIIIKTTSRNRDIMAPIVKIPWILGMSKVASNNVKKNSDSIDIITNVNIAIRDAPIVSTTI